MSDINTSKRRRSGRSPSERTTGIAQLPWRHVTNRYQPTLVLDPEQVEAIHDASLDILEEIGIEFLSPAAAAAMVRAGGSLGDDGIRLRLDRAMVLEAVARAPASFTLHARNPAHDLTFGAGRINFATVASAPNASDLDGGRRPGNFVDFQNLVRLGQALNIVHMIGGYPVEPTDLPASARHLDCYLSMIGLTDKLWRPYALGGGRIDDAIEMAAIARGLDRDGLALSPSVITNVNTNSPLRVDGPMLDGLAELARA